jgi:predicted kinase
MLILESDGTQGYKMIFLAGLPGGGKSTLIRQLGIESQFTNCNIDNFYEPELEKELGTKDLHTTTDRYVRFKKRLDKEDYLPTDKEMQSFIKDKDFVSKSASIFGQATSKFKKQVGEVCQLGSNFIIDGTAANYKRTAIELERFTEMGYDCAMILVDIDIETSQQRNLDRGKKGGRSIYNTIIWRQGKSMSGNAELYQELFEPDRFFLVPNLGSFEEFKERIESIRPAVQAFMES